MEEEAWGEEDGNGVGELDGGNRIWGLGWGQLGMGGKDG